MEVLNKIVSGKADDDYFINSARARNALYFLLEEEIIKEHKDEFILTRIGKKLVNQNNKT